MKIDGTLEVVLGPMFAAKTGYLSSRTSQFADLGKKVIYINSDKDNRSSEGFSTHSKILIPHEGVTYVKSRKLLDVDVSHFDVIGIDESQMFPDLFIAVRRWVLEMHKCVIVVGLDGDLRRGVINLQAMMLMPFATSFNKQCSSCRECLAQNNFVDAPSTAGLFESMYKSSVVENIGGKEKYGPMCNRHMSTHLYKMMGEEYSSSEPTIKNLESLVSVLNNMIVDLKSVSTSPPSPTIELERSSSTVTDYSPDPTVESPVNRKRIYEFDQDLPVSKRSRV